MTANVNRTPQHHNRFQANSIKNSQVIARGWMDRQPEMVVKLWGIFLASFLPITHQKQYKPQDKRVRAEDNDIENNYGAMHKNR